MKSLAEQVRDIFKETVSCKNCPYKNKDGYCTRIKDLFDVEVKTANDSTCICLDGFKIISKDKGCKIKRKRGDKNEQRKFK